MMNTKTNQIKTYIYTGKATTSMSIKISETEMLDVVLYPNCVVNLPENHPNVQLLLARKTLEIKADAEI